MQDNRISQKTLDHIQEVANDRIDEVFAALDIEGTNSGGWQDEIRCACPCHGGDNTSAFSYSLKYKNWRCYTHSCEKNTNSFIAGLVQQIRQINFFEAVKWLSSLLGISINNEVPQAINEDEKIINVLLKESRLKRDIINRSGGEQNGKNPLYPFPVNRIEGLIEPSEYFLNQGFSKEILTKYNVGYCEKPNKPMYLRSYAPVLDDSGEMVIGATGRIKYEKCEYCPLFHDQSNGCPKDNPKVRGYPKWFHDGFTTSNILYNSSFARKFISESGITIICESTKNVWWLEQHGIHNSVCIFGLRLSKQHLAKLIEFGSTKIVLALDKDEAGIEATEEISIMLENYFKIFNIQHLMEDNEDLANIQSDRINSHIIPFLKNLEPKYAAV